MPNYCVTVNVYIQADDEVRASETADAILARASHHAALTAYVVDEESISEVTHA